MSKGLTQPKALAQSSILPAPKPLPSDVSKEPACLVSPGNKSNLY